MKNLGKVQSQICPEMGDFYSLAEMNYSPTGILTTKEAEVEIFFVHLYLSLKASAMAAFRRIGLKCIMISVIKNAVNNHVL